MSPISSRKIVPPDASSNFPLRCCAAPVNAPRSYPNNSDSIKFSGSAAQFTATNASAPRRPLVNFLRQQILARPALAQESKPSHPSAATRSAISKTRRIAADAPSNRPNCPSATSSRRNRAFSSPSSASCKIFATRCPQLLDVESLHNVIRRSILQRFHRRLRRIQRRNHKHRRLVARSRAANAKTKAHPPPASPNPAESNPAAAQPPPRAPPQPTQPRQPCTCSLERPPHPIPRRRLVIHQQNRSHQFISLPSSASGSVK